MRIQWYVFGTCAALLIPGVPGAAAATIDANARDLRAHAREQLTRAGAATLAIRWNEESMTPGFIQMTERTTLPGLQSDPDGTLGRFFENNSALFGFRKGIDGFRVTRDVRERGVRFLRIQQTYKNVPVFGADYAVAVGPEDDLRVFNGNYAADIDIAKVRPADTAPFKWLARARLDERGQRNALIAEPVQQIGVVAGEYRVIVRVHVNDPATAFEEDLVFDAVSAQLVARESTITNAPGFGAVYTRSEVPNPANPALPNLSPSKRQLTVIRDGYLEDPRFSLDTLPVSGPTFTVPYTPGSSFLYTPGGSEDGYFNQVNVFYHVQKALDRLNPGGYRVPIYIRIEDLPTNTCGTTGTTDGHSGIAIRYYGLANSNRNAAKDPDCILHELGHAVLQQYGILSGRVGDFIREAPSFHEGFADEIATLIANDPEMGEYSYNGPQGATQANSDPAVYRFNNWSYIGLIWGLNDIYGHGMIWSGATWRLNQLTQGKALDLQMAALNYMPSGPTFIAGRDALLAADKEFFAGAYRPAIVQAFAEREIGGNTP